MKKGGRLILTLIILLLADYSFGQTDFSNKEYWRKKIISDTSLTVIRHALEKNDYTVGFDTSMIPKDLAPILSKWAEEQFILANPGDLFNATDVIDDASLPSRRLIAVYSNENHTFITYEHGGTGFHKHIIWCKTDHNEITDLWICNYLGSINGKIQLVEFLNKFKRAVTLKNGRTVRNSYVCF
ncbi:MAG: hypothetical protein JWM14_2029 [Chitinophagaceae bacterium]|nr:hypothetical protein [Chitinophagaceae bacterium]